MKQITLFLFCLTIGTFARAQQLTQTIRGQVTDNQSKATLPGVNIMVLNSDPILGTTSDLDGYFAIEQVPIGRVSIQATFIGYEPFIVNNLELTSGKELMLNFSMSEQVITMNEVVVRAKDDKMETNNEMTTVSARQFTIEESMRYAGARNDVSRMAQNFAGVRGSNDAVNDIVIRGNSPVGVLWRLEGIDIPNPNHFGDLGSTGGPVSMLNNNILANSDFLTGAFPAEYGNGISGVFDLKMRNGNYKKHEFLGQVGLNGFEFGAEGPLSKDSKSSYLMNYRYSTLGLMSAIGINFGTGTAIPYYQDITFRVNMPTRKAGTFALFGLGGVSSIDLISSSTEDSVDNLYNNDLDIYDKSKIGMVGFTHQYLINDKSYTRFTLSTSSIENTDIIDSISSENFEPINYYNQNFTQHKASASLMYKIKLNSRQNLQAGASADMLFADLNDSIYRNTLDRWITITSYNGNTMLLQGYVQYQIRLTENLTATAGVHDQFLALNGSNSVEPRAGMKYTINEKNAISFGYGLHSMMAPISVYFKTVETTPGNYITPNDSIDFIKAHHFVLGYDRQLSSTMRFRSEIYYQHLYDVLIDRDSSSYSVLNTGSMTFGSPDYLVNKGTGRNYGAEVTLEKFLDKGLYFLVTGSIYKSEYLGSDDIERETAFSGNYVANVVGGKEFAILAGRAGAKTKKSVVFDTKLTMAGGQRYTPIDLTASIDEGKTVYDWDKAFEAQFDDYFRWDVRLAFKMDGKHASQEWAIDVQNVTNEQNPLYQRYNPVSQTVNTIYQLGIFPVPQYRITF
ncbi:MAG TPA: TonB-dependent receptor [Chitinophagales bacterium]|nr:TonB-dependent receptor [Chitinophagales bacterium]HMZ88687.1 TonB-dependent receptor [Chitinophagales bacterium]HNM28821.1 TonB-dependent receptor [Chitinophagales bacterium]HNO28515.1 TonB-dependent receptor [Chitinophagales bacterium]